jgi:hypothetical protein
MRNFSDKSVEEIQTHILYSKTFFRKSCRLRNNKEKYGTARQATDDNIIRRMRFACWINKAIDTRSEHVILIAFPRQQWLRERALMLYVRRALPVWLDNAVSSQEKTECRRKLSWLNFRDYSGTSLEALGEITKNICHCSRFQGRDTCMILELSIHSRSVIIIWRSLFNLLKPSGNFTYHQV